MNLTITTLLVDNNKALIAPKPANVTNFSNFNTASPTYNLNIPSPVMKCSLNGIGDGDFMILNQDIDHDGYADLNIVFANGNGVPARNIDVNCDGKADLNIGSDSMGWSVGDSIHNYQ
jgi:methenyltetrahydromethanopterin cyclohydrolase